MSEPDVAEVFLDESGEWRWRRKAANHEVIATSGEGYVSKDHAIDMARRVNGPEVYITVDRSKTEEN